MANEDKVERSAENITSNPPEIKIETTCGPDGDDQSRLMDRLYRAVEPFGNNREQFFALIRAAYLHVDPFNEARLSDAALIALAKENNGQNNAYTDLQEMLQAFEKALGNQG